MTGDMNQHALDALKLSAMLADYGTSIINGRIPTVHDSRAIAMQADIVFMQDVSNYGPWGEAVLAANDIDEQDAVKEWETVNRSDQADYDGMIGKP